MRRVGLLTARAVQVWRGDDLWFERARAASQVRPHSGRGHRLLRDEDVGMARCPRVERLPGQDCVGGGAFHQTGLRGGPAWRERISVTGGRLTVRGRDGHAKREISRLGTHALDTRARARCPRHGGIRATALPGPQAGGAARQRAPRRGGGGFLRGESVVPDHLLQGHVHGLAVVRVLPGPCRRAGQVRPGHRTPAVQHEHLSQLAAGPAVPMHRPQRRDQHAQRQPQFHAGPRAEDGQPAPRRRAAA